MIIVKANNKKYKTSTTVKVHFVYRQITDEEEGDLFGLVSLMTQHNMPDVMVLYNLVKSCIMAYDETINEKKLDQNLQTMSSKDLIKCGTKLIEKLFGDTKEVKTTKKSKPL